MGGSVDPSAFYFRISPTFETGRAEYACLNRIVAVDMAVGIGCRVPTGRISDIYEVLLSPASDRGPLWRSSANDMGPIKLAGDILQFDLGLAR
jgi:hypothetical protein